MNARNIHPPFQSDKTPAVTIAAAVAAIMHNPIGSAFPTQVWHRGIVSVRYSCHRL